MLAVSPDGVVYVAENYAALGGPRVARITPDGGRATVLNTTWLSGVTGVALGPDGTLYVGDGAGNGNASLPGGNRVVMLRPDGGVSTLGPITNPTGIAVDDGGTVYVASFSNKAVYRFSASGAALGQFGPLIPEAPYGLALGADGNLFVAGFGLTAGSGSAYGTKVYALAPSGQLAVFGNPGFADPFGVAVAPDGRLWASYYNSHKLVRFERDGGFATIPGGWIADDTVNGLGFDARGALYFMVNGGATTSTAAVLKVSGQPPGCPLRAP